MRVDGHAPLSTNDLTLAEVEVVEGVSGVPWSLMNPLANIKVATGLLAVAAMHGGMVEREAIEYARSRPLEVLAGAFEFRVGDDPPEPAEGGGGDDPPPSAATSSGG